MGRRKKHEEHAHAESWLVSYCDMISLLVTFFLMMMTFSTHDQFDVKEVGVGILHGRGGIWKNPVCLPAETQIDQETLAKLSRGLAEMTEESGQTASLRPVSDGFTVSFDLESSFAPGEALVPPALRSNLERLAVALAPHPRLVVVDGFTDTAFQPNSAFATENDLALARAQGAADVLLATKKFLPEQVQVSSLGSLRPRAQNDTAIGRASNRRVEVRVVSLAPTQNDLQKREESGQ